MRIRNVTCGGVYTGSGFILDEHTIVTNHHVVANRGRLEVTLSDGTDIAVTGSTVATNADVATITTVETLSPAAILSDRPAETEGHDFRRRLPRGRRARHQQRADREL